MIDVDGLDENASSPQLVDGMVRGVPYTLPIWMVMGRERPARGQPTIPGRKNEYYFLAFWKFGNHCFPKRMAVVSEGVLTATLRRLPLLLVVAVVVAAIVGSIVLQLRTRT